MIRLYVPMYGPMADTLLGAYTPFERCLQAFDACREFDVRSVLYNQEPVFEAVETLRRFPEWKRVGLPEQSGMYPTSLFKVLAGREAWADEDVLAYVNPLHPFLSPEQVLTAVLRVQCENGPRLLASASQPNWGCALTEQKEKPHAVLTPMQTVSGAFLVTTVAHLKTETGLDTGKWIDFGDWSKVELVPLSSREALALRNAEDWDIARAIVFAGS